MTKVEHITDPATFMDLLSSDQQEVTNVNFINDEMVELSWRYKKDFIDSSNRTNVIVAAYTSAQARIKLYSYLDSLQERVLYCDTDSIVFTRKQGNYIPPLGDFLGDLTNEVPHGEITQFVTAGPKNYAYTVATEDGKQTVCKVKGITLCFKTALVINFDTIKSMVVDKSLETI